MIFNLYLTPIIALGNLFWAGWSIFWAWWSANAYASAIKNIDWENLSDHEKKLQISQLTFLVVIGEFMDWFFIAKAFRASKLESIVADIFDILITPNYNTWLSGMFVWLATDHDATK